MSKRQVFFCFEYNKDAWRAVQILNICLDRCGVVTTNRDWEEVRVKSAAAIKDWIDERIAQCDCVVVLIGTTTAYRKWVLYDVTAGAGCPRIAGDPCPRFAENSVHRQF